MNESLDLELGENDFRMLLDISMCQSCVRSDQQSA